MAVPPSLRAVFNSAFRLLAERLCGTRLRMVVNARKGREVVFENSSGLPPGYWDSLRFIRMTFFVSFTKPSNLKLWTGFYFFCALFSTGFSFSTYHHSFWKYNFVTQQIHSPCAKASHILISKLLREIAHLHNLMDPMFKWKEPGEVSRCNEVEI